LIAQATANWRAVTSSPTKLIDFSDEGKRKADGDARPLWRPRFHCPRRALRTARSV